MKVFILLGIFSLSLAQAQNSQDFNEYYKTDIFTDSKVQFDVDGFVDSGDKYESENEYKKFEQKCLFEIPNRQRNLFYSLQTYHPEININDFAFSSDVVAKEIGKEKQMVCRLTVDIARNARYLIKRFFSEVYLGKESEKKCMEKIGSLEGRQEELNLLSRRALVLYKKKTFGGLKAEKCQVMFVTLKANPNYNPNPDCDSKNEFAVNLSAQPFDLTDLPQTILPYTEYSKPIVKVSTLEQNALYSKDYNAKYYKNNMLLVSFKASQNSASIPWDQIDSVKEAKLNFSYTKYVSDSFNDTEVLCFLSNNPSDRVCNGQLFYEPKWKDLINKTFFSVNKDVVGNSFSALFPKGARVGTVFSGNASFDTMKLYKNDQIVNSLKNGGFNMVFADDTYIKSGAQMNIKFACRPKK